MESILSDASNEFQSFWKKNVSSSSKAPSDIQTVREIIEWVVKRDRIFSTTERKELTELLFHLHNTSLLVQATDHHPGSSPLLTEHRRLIFVLLTSLPLQDEHLAQGQNTNSINNLQLKAKFGLHLAKTYLVQEAGSSSADPCLTWVEEVIQLSLKRVSEEKNPSTGAGTDQVRSLHGQLLACLLYRTECQISAGSHQEAGKTYVRVLELLTDFANLRLYATRLCFNAGLTFYRSGRYQESVIWLRQGYSTGQSICVGDQNSQEKNSILLLMANVYLSWNAKLHWEKAVSALNIIENSHALWEANLLKMRAYIEGGALPRHIEAVASLCHRQSKNFSIENALSIINLLIKHDLKETAVNILKELIVKFCGVPDADKLIDRQLEILLTDNSAPEDVIEDALRNYVSSKRRRHGDFLRLVDIRAKSMKDQGNWERAVVWFSLCIAMLSTAWGIPETESNVGKFHQQICNCYIELRQYREASIALKCAESVASEHDVINDYLKLKLCVVGYAPEAVATILDTMTCSLTTEERETNNTASRQTLTKEQLSQLVLGLGQFAVKEGKEQTALDILENQVFKIINPFVQLAVLKCILKLKVGRREKSADDIAQQWLIHFSTSVRDCLYGLKSVLGFEEFVTSSSKWFAKILWNVGQGHFGVDHLFGFTLLRICNQILSASWCEDYAVFLQRQTVLLLATSLGLEFIRTNGITKSPELLPEDILHSIDECKQICTSLSRSSLSAQLASTLVSSNQRLLVFEFETKVMLRQMSDALMIIQRARSQPNIEASTFKKFASVALVNAGDNYTLIVPSLKLAIDRLSKIEPRDYAQLFGLYRSLCFEILTKMQGSAAYEEDLTECLSDLAKLIKETPTQSLIQAEILWFVTRIWNSGVQRFLRDKSSVGALTWCRVAQDMTCCLPTVSSVYREKMMSILDNLTSPTATHAGCPLTTRF